MSNRWETNKAAFGSYEGDYEMLRSSGRKQIFFEGLIDLRHIRVEEICVVDVFLKINVVDRRRWDFAV